jgi:hypothetical protein
MSPRETTGRWHKKVGETEQSGINLKIPHSSLQECPVKHLYR